jgi:tetratricopeptide (TPR) repeat protein
MNPQVAFLLSKALECLNLSNLDTAKLYLYQASKFQPKNPEVLRLLGVTAGMGGNHSEALDYFEQLIKLKPKSAIAFSNKGNALQGLKCYEDALMCYDKAISLEPTYHEVFNNKGNALQRLKRYEDALMCYDKAISLEPTYHEAFSNKGNALQELRCYEDALICYDKALLLQPSYHEALRNKGHALQELKCYEDALICYDLALSLQPTYQEAYINKAYVLKVLKKYDEALKNYDKALALNNSSTNAFSGKAQVHFDLKKLTHAREFYRQALTIDSDDAIANYGLGNLELSQLNFSDGWRGYEYRWTSEGFDSPPLVTIKPSWLGAAQQGSLLVWSEQGIGDQILYSSMLNELAEFCQRNVISLDKKLLPIFRRSFPNYEFINKEDPISEDIYEEHIPIGSLGGIFRNSLEDFQRAHHPYIFDDVARTQSIRSRSDFKNKITCGVSWGSSNWKVGDDKSIPIQDLYPILKMNNIEFVNLQYGDTKRTLLRVKEEIGKKILNLDEIDLFKDVDGALSIIAACDIVVTSSNSTAHLAGALGKETLLLVPYSVGRFWYWHAVDGKSIWYPSVKVFEQEHQGDWSAPVNAVKQYLESRFG